MSYDMAGNGLTLLALSYLLVCFLVVAFFFSLSLTLVRLSLPYLSTVLFAVSSAFCKKSIRANAHTYTVTIAIP